MPSRKIYHLCPGPPRGCKLCKSCGFLVLKKGQNRKHPDDYRHARGCPNDDGGWDYRMFVLVRELDVHMDGVSLSKRGREILVALRSLVYDLEEGRDDGVHQ